MTIQFIAKPNLTAQQIQMCQNYLLSLQYGNIAEADSLGFINFICNRFGATVSELAWVLEQIKAYDNQVRCQYCGIMWQIKKPIATTRHTIPYQRQWTCNSCQNFLSKQDKTAYSLIGDALRYQKLETGYPFNL